ncbi:MAG: DEAD/DEAH box helicase [Solirubrobacterales bacterium]
MDSSLNGTEQKVAGAVPEPVVKLRIARSELAEGGGGEPFRAEVLLRSSGGEGDFRPVAEFWGDEDSFGSRGRIDTTMEVGRAAAIWSPLRGLLEQDLPDRTALSIDDLGELVDGVAERLTEAGLPVEWAEGLDPGLRSTLVAGSSARPLTSVPDAFDGDDPVALTWRLSIDGEALSDEERTAVAVCSEGVINLRGRDLIVGPTLAARARRPEVRSLTAIEALAASLSGVANVDGERFEVQSLGWLEELRRELGSPPEQIAGEPPPGFEGTLRPYQLAGLSWLERMTMLGLGGCLADDMGLGKTVMLIALHLARHQAERGEGPTLVICPTSILANWEREIGRFAPGEPVVRYHGPERSLDGVSRGFVVTSYGTVRSDIETLGRIEWGLIAADEAQHFKNPGTATAKAVRSLPGRARVALTGTPIENRLTELWSILDWTTPGLLGSAAEFRKRWASDVETDEDPTRSKELASLVGPFVLRRRKSDPGILPELPEKIEIDHAVTMSEEQIVLYEEVSGRMLRAIGSAAGIQRKGLVLELITSLKQICNHPAQYLGQAEPVLSGRSGKLDLFDDLVTTAVEEGGRMLVFTQYVEMGRLLTRRLDELGIESSFLHGGTSVSAREKMVDAFQAGEFPVFVLSLRAGGQGLNLTGADHVLHYDRWWNPAVEDQATDRAHRIGQDRAVEVHRLIAEGTVEDEIALIHERKRALAEAVVGGGPEAFTELGQAELVEILALRQPDGKLDRAA